MGAAEQGRRCDKLRAARLAVTCRHRRSFGRACVLGYDMSNGHHCRFKSLGDACGGGGVDVAVPSGGLSGGLRWPGVV